MSSATDRTRRTARRWCSVCTRTPAYSREGPWPLSRRNLWQRPRLEGAGQLCSQLCLTKAGKNGKKKQKLISIHLSSFPLSLLACVTISIGFAVRGGGKAPCGNAECSRNRHSNVPQQTPTWRLSNVNKACYGFRIYLQRAVRKTLWTFDNAPIKTIFSISESMESDSRSLWKMNISSISRHFDLGFKRVWPDLQKRGLFKRLDKSTRCIWSMH